MVNKILKNKKKKILISLFSIAIIIGIVSSTLLLINMGKKIKPIASIDTGGEAVDVEVIDGIAYVSDMTANTLTIFNVSDPYDPELLSSFPAHGNHQLTVRGDIVFLTDHEYGMILVNVSDPTHPVKISNYLYNTGEIDDVWVEDDLMYIVDQYDGLEIVNISDPIHPTWMSHFNFGTNGYKVDVFVKSKLVYLTDANEGLFIVNASDPSNPTLSGRLDTPGLCWMDYYNECLYIPQDGNILIVNITDPTNPEIETSIAVGQYPFVVTIKDGIALVSDGRNGENGVLYILNLADPLSPRILGQYSGKGIPFGSYIDGKYIYAAFTTQGLLIFSLPEV